MSVVELRSELRGELGGAVRADPRPRPRPQLRSAGARGPRRGWHRWVSPLAVVLLWQLASALGPLPARLLAAPSQIAVTALDLVRSGTLPTAIAVSLERVLLGFAAGAVAGVGLALVAGLSRPVRTPSTRSCRCSGHCPSSG
ncbi:hypothetical protein GCM10027612_38350 [Microbispora bryophytorum subsp. camponoti]